MSWLLAFGLLPARGRCGASGPVGSWRRAGERSGRRQPAPARSRVTGTLRRKRPRGRDAVQGFALFGPLEPATEAALRASIERFGVLVPVTFDQRGRILDGHHRWRMAAELGVDCPY